MRTSKTFTLDNPEQWREKALFWSSTFSHFAYTNPNNQKFPFKPFQEIIAADAIESFYGEKNDTFNGLKEFHDKHNDWIFGYLGYNLKNEVEKTLSSKFPPRTSHPETVFFAPKHLLFFKENIVEISSTDDPQSIFETIKEQEVSRSSIPKISFNPVMSKDDYLKNAEAVINHIIEGDIYELNLCMEFFATNVHLNPLSAYLKLVNISPTPFSGFFKENNNYFLCASPERFLKKKGLQLISQPIKGTAKRNSDPAIDNSLKEALRNDEKERAENMMIVDLVRNDLAKSSNYGSIKVEEIFGIYSFKQWHQMISTVSSTSRNDIHWVEIIKNAFPMGSMTGAPKIKVMELIEEYEKSARGVYSGAFGYVSPEGNFDFNVVIRSLLYDSSKSILSFHVGSALTYEAVPEKEYEECLLKASAIFELFNGKN